MKVLNILHRSLTIGAALYIAATFVAAANAQTIKNIVLVHGAWADGSSWSKVIPLLEAKGFNVVAVQNPLTSLAEDVATTKRAIALMDGPVVLVGHSYGGVVITEAGNDSKVAALVYVAAFAPDHGESALSMGNAYPPAPGGSEIRPDATGYLKLTSTGIEEDFGPDLSPVDRRLLMAVQGPTAAAALNTPVTTAAWKIKPTWFAIAANDRMIQPDMQRVEAKKMNATSVTLDASHVAMLAQPAKVAALIEDAAAKASKTTASASLQ